MITALRIDKIISHTLCWTWPGGRQGWGCGQYRGCEQLFQELMIFLFLVVTDCSYNIS